MAVSKLRWMAFNITIKLGLVAADASVGFIHLLEWCRRAWAVYEVGIPRFPESNL